MPDMTLPEEFKRTIIGVDGDNGASWLEQLPTILETCASRWDVTLGPHFEPLTYNYVAPGVRADGRAVVLKAGVPGKERQYEAAALRYFDGRGMVKLLEADDALGVMLLERLHPGTALVEMPDDEATTAIAAQVMRELWHPLPADHPFRTVADWGQGFQRLWATFDGATGPFSRPLVERAESLFAELLASSEAPVLLHGDLHHGNILAAERAPWLAIDPQGVAGEPAYEVGAWMRNPVPQVFTSPHPDRLLLRRADIFAEHLGIDRWRLLAWSMAQAVLSAWWSYEDHDSTWEPVMEWAGLLARLL
ncbi:MAG TPA: aminoglycoside phosphotransferase family protein [Ktedonobacterales bacterium]